MIGNIPFFSSLLGRELSNNAKSTSSHVLVYGAIEFHCSGVRGCIASNRKIGEETGLKETTVANVISILNKSKWIEVTMDKNNHRTGIKTNYKLFLPSEPPFTPRVTPLHSPVNIKNSNKEQVTKVTNGLTLALEDFKQHRKEMRRTITPRAYDLLLLKLEKLAGEDDSAKIAILNQSIESGWSGIFALKADNQPQTKSKGMVY